MKQQKKTDLEGGMRIMQELEKWREMATSLL